MESPTSTLINADCSIEGRTGPSDVPTTHDVLIVRVDDVTRRALTGSMTTSFADATTVLFNNGAADNSTVMVGFTSGANSTVTFEENPAGGAGVPIVLVPEVRRSILFGLGLLGLAFSSRHREPPRSGGQ